MPARRGDGLGVAKELAQCVLYPAPRRLDAALEACELVARKLEAELGPTGGRPAALVLTGTVLECGQVDVPGGADGRGRRGSGPRRGGILRRGRGFGVGGPGHATAFRLGPP